MPRLILTLTVNQKRALSFSKQGYSNATDLADYLTMKGTPFRDSHEIVGKIVRHAELKNTTLDDLPLKDFNKFSKIIGDDVYSAINIEKSIHKKIASGSTSPLNVKKSAKKILASLEKNGYK